MGPEEDEPTIWFRLYCIVAAVIAFTLPTLLFAGSVVYFLLEHE